MIKLWELSYSVGDFHINCFSVDKKQTKVVRYCDTEKIQSIQFDGKRSTSLIIQYICENKSFDICLAENETRAVVVVIHAGKHFIHNGSCALH